MKFKLGPADIKALNLNTDYKLEAPDFLYSRAGAFSWDEPILVRKQEMVMFQILKVLVLKLPEEAKFS